MSKNQNLEGTQNDQNQNNAMSDDDMGDGRRLSKNLRGEGAGPDSERYQNQGKDRLDELGRQGGPQR